MNRHSIAILIRKTFLQGGMSKAPLISIVDDDALARDGIRELVESLGYKTTTFESAEDFLQSSMVAETTCLITDLQMSGLSGLELQEALRAQGYQTPVILITAYPNDKNRTSALDKGAVGFLSKPFDEASLIECLTTAITTRARGPKRFITLGCTTSMRDSGLLGHILPLFNAASGMDVHIVAVGSGRALAMGARGDADALLVHDRAGADKFVADGLGVDCRDVMYNDFVLVGPSSDPAHIRGLRNARQALSQIAGAAAPFASRGDDSGTHRMELRLWKSVGITPDAHSGWYRDVGQAMGATLGVAAVMNAYTLTDRATWLKFENGQGLVVLTDVDPALFNPYDSILVNPAKQPNVKFDDAKVWHEWLTTKPGLDAISSYRINGEELFFRPRAAA
jgi:tungstate transport system substrate-binding protein